MTAPAQAEVSCPACHAPLTVPAAALGRRVRCAGCGKVFTAANPAAPAEPVAKAAPEPVLVPVPVEDENPFALPSGPPAERRREPDREEPRRGRKQPEPTTGPNKGLLIGLIAGGGMLLLLVGALGAYAIFAATREPAKQAESAKEKEPPRKEKPSEKPKELLTTSDGRMTDATRERVKAATVYIRTHYEDGKVGSGSGFFAAGPGLVVTNAHVVGHNTRGVKAVKRAAVEQVEVVVNSGLPTSRTLEARVLKADEELDLALLRVEGPDLPRPLPVDDAFDLKETQEIYIFGFPLGENLGREISVNISRVSSIRRDEDIPWIQVSGGMHPGNSGGPVTDAAGRVVGVARAKIAGTDINIAIPGDIVHSFFNNAGNLIPKTPPK